jgi:hypothetical protein
VATAESKSDSIDPRWPHGIDAKDHPVGEFTSDRQGSLSPFGDETFPVPAEELPYVHPVTVVNR